MKVNFTINCEMEDRWVNDFYSFLKYMQFCGEQGHSALVGFYSDGDGDFRPKFKIKSIDKSFKLEEVNGRTTEQTPEIMFDAG